MIVIFLPALAALVAFVFAAQLLRQYRTRRRGHALAWAMSLALFGIASAAVAAGVGAGWSVPVFAVYWVAGALLNVPLLAVGQLLLLDPKRSVLWWTLAGIAGAWALLFTAMATFDTSVLAQATQARTIPLGREVMAGTIGYTLARPMSYTFAVVVIGSIYSAVRARRPGILLIAFGVTVAAAASGFARVGQGELFSVCLASGVIIMYVGFLAAARAPRASITAEPVRA